MVKAVFLDRDGVINELANHNGKLTAPWHVSELKIYKESKQAIDLLRKLGYYIFVLTNQPDVYDGKMEYTDLVEINTRIRKELNVDLILCALKRKTSFYKPNNMMIEYLLGYYDLDHTQCYMVGDSWKDIVCGYTSGVKTIYIGEEFNCPDEYDGVKPDYLAKNILKACELIEENDND